MNVKRTNPTATQSRLLKKKQPIQIHSPPVIDIKNGTTTASSTKLEQQQPQDTTTTTMTTTTTRRRDINIDIPIYDITKRIEVYWKCHNPYY